MSSIKRKATIMWGLSSKKVPAMTIRVESEETWVKHVLNWTFSHQPWDVKQWSWRWNQAGTRTQFTNQKNVIVHIVFAQQGPAQAGQLPSQVEQRLAFPPVREAVPVDQIRCVFREAKLGTSVVHATTVRKPSLIRRLTDYGNVVDGYQELLI